MDKNEWSELCFICIYVIAAIAVSCILVGVCMYCDWLKTIKLYNAGLIYESNLEWSKIVCYEPAIHTMSAGAILLIINAAAFVITKAIKNEKKS